MRRTMKQSISALLAAVILLSLCPIPSVRAAETTSQSLWSQQVEEADGSISGEKTYKGESYPKGDEQITPVKTGVFRVIYEAEAGETLDPETELTFVVKSSNGWQMHTGKTTTPSSGYVDYKVEDLEPAWPSASNDPETLIETLVMIETTLEETAEGITIKGVNYLASETAPPVEFKIDDNVDEIPYRKKNKTPCYEITDVNFSSLKKTDYFRFSYKPQDTSTPSSVGLRLCTGDNYSGWLAGTTQNPTVGENFIDFSLGSLSDSDFGQVTQASTVWVYAEVWDNSIVIDQIDLYTEKEDDGSTVITPDDWKNEGYAEVVKPGGYFRIEYEKADGDSPTLTFNGTVPNVTDAYTHISPSLGSDGAVRKGTLGDNKYYAEFAYVDCLNAWNEKTRETDFNNLNQINMQENYSGNGLSNVSIRYYEEDMNPPPVKGTLNTDIVALNETIEVSLESGTATSYQWYRVVGNATQNGTAISGATSKSYTPTENDKGCWLYCMIDGNIAAGPAAVVVSRETKETVVFSGSETMNAKYESKTLWTPSSAESTFSKTMIVPGGRFLMKCEPANANVQLVLKEPWSQVVGTQEEDHLAFSYDEIVKKYTDNLNKISYIEVQSQTDESVTVTELKWIGPDVGVTEAPYMPTDELSFKEGTWERDWAAKTIEQDKEKNMVSVTPEYDSSSEWSEARVKTHSADGFKVDGRNMISLNVYLETSKVDEGVGELRLRLIGGDKDLTGEYKLNTSGDDVVKIGSTEYYRTPLNISVSAFPARFYDFVLSVRGVKTSYNGEILMDNLILRKNEEEKDITVPEADKALSRGSTTVTISGSEEDRPSAYYGDAIKVGVKLASKPTKPVKVTVTLNEDQKTESSKEIPADQFTEEPIRAITNGWTAETEVPVPCTVGKVDQVEVKVEGDEGLGAIELTELAIVDGEDITPPESSGGSGGGGGGGGGSSQASVSLPHTWDFNTGLQGWKYEKGWNSDYSGTSGTSARTQDGRMAVNVDYSKDGDKSWSQMAVTLWHNDGMAIQYATHASLDLYYLPEKLNGSLALKLYSGGAGIDTEGNIQWDKAETVKIDGSEYKKVHVDFDFSPIAAGTVHDMALCLIGRNTTYRGPLLIGDLTIEEAFAGSFVLSRNQVKKDNSTLRVSNGVLTTASKEEIALPKQVTLVDGKATSAVRTVYAYLQAVGSSKDVLFGQQYNFGQKAGSANLSDSDTYDVVGDYSAVYGLDALALTGSEFSASRCNQLYGTPFPSTAEGNVVAAAYLTNTAIKRGAIVTLSCHMPNFSQVKTITPNCSASYARYDFSGYTPNVLTGDTANEILPGGKYNEMFNAYLDMIADYANRVNGAVLFRPFHENTGSWFWWGKAFCDAETYKNIYRYTVEYLRDEKGVHNFLYVYGPGSEAESLADYAKRYPGDSYVDMVGFDMYNSDPDVNSGWMSAFKRELELVSQFAAEHGKLVAVTETGAANTTVEGDRQTALLRTGNKDKDWFNRVLDIVSDSPASYLLVWANFGQTNGFYTPYVIRTEGRRLYGHEMMDNFIDYYNDARSIFASDQKRVLGAIPAVTAKAVNDGAEGYITSPVSGRRILNATEFTARVTNSSGAAVQFILHGNGKDITLTAKSSDGVYYSAQLSKDALESLGSYAGGSAELMVGGKSQQTIRLIYNISEGRFTDVPSNAWFYGAVEYVAAKNIMSGVGNGLFDPDSPMTRAMMVQVLYNMEGRPEVDGQGTFQDVSDSMWYAPAINWASSEKVASGYSSTEFGPEDKVTREQMTVMLYNYAKMKGYEVFADADLNVFTDAGDISPWALEAVQWANGTGLLNGMGDGTLAPRRGATRAQLASILTRFCEKIP